MQQSKVPRLGFGTSNWRATGPDPLDHPEYYHSILSRRFLAWLIDMVIIFLLMAGVFFVLLFSKIISLGLLALPVSLGFLMVPIIYYMVLLSGPNSATPGMRALGIELRSWNNMRPDYGQALLRTALHYATVMVLSPLVMVVMLFNKRRRAAHDYLSGTVVVNCLTKTEPDIVDHRVGTRRALR